MLHHSVTSLAQTLDYIKVAQGNFPAQRTLDQLTLKLSERKLKAYMNTLAYTEKFSVKSVNI